jgi:hypothetical protein
MNARWTVPLAAGMAMVLGGALRAAAAEPASAAAIPNPPAAQAAATPQNSTFAGTAVLNLRHQKLGQIRETYFDAQTGQASFVILDAEIPGSGHAMLVVPYKALIVSFNPADHRLMATLNLQPDQLRAAPQIQNNQWQKMQDSQFLAQARDFYQITPYVAARPIEQPSPAAPATMAPTLAAPTVVYPPPVQYFVAPPPCVRYGSPWTQDLEDFSQE